MPVSPRSLLDRFWEKVDDTAGPDACWPWRGAIYVSRNCRDGYGKIRSGGRGTPFLAAHRFACVLATGEEPEGREAGHAPRCTTTLCCNPRHLRWVTRAENEADKRWKQSDRDLIADALARVLADPEYAGVVTEVGAGHVAH